MAQYTIITITGQQIPSESAPSIRNNCLFSAGVYFPLTSVLAFGETENLRNLLPQTPAQTTQPSQAPRATRYQAPAAAPAPDQNSSDYYKGKDPQFGYISVKATQYGYKVKARTETQGEIWAALEAGDLPHTMSLTRCVELIRAKAAQTPRSRTR